MTKKRGKIKKSRLTKASAKDRILGSVHSAETAAKHRLALASEIEAWAQEVLSGKGVKVSRGRKQDVALVHDGPHNERPEERVRVRAAAAW